MDAVLLIGAAVLAWHYLRSSDQANTAEEPAAHSPAPSSTAYIAPINGNTGDGPTNVLDNITQAIKQFEGGNKDPRVTATNPGNLKRIDGSFAVYADEGDGWQALYSYVQRHAQKHPDWDFYDFFNYYLHGSTTAQPADKEGNADRYAEFVASYAGLDPGQTVFSALGYTST